MFDGIEIFSERRANEQVKIFVLMENNQIYNGVAFGEKTDQIGFNEDDNRSYFQ